MEYDEPPVMWISHTPEHNWLQMRLQTLGVDVRRVPIEDGDVWWLGRHNELVMSELKTTNEILTSFCDERLLAQVWRMYESADVVILLYHGYLVPSPDGLCRIQPVRAKLWDTDAGCVKVRYDSFMDYLAGLNQHGIITEYLPISEYLPDRLIRLYHWTNKDNHKTLRPALPMPKVSGEEFRKLRKLMTTDGIGEELATRLLAAHEGSPWEAIRNIMEAEGDKAQDKELLKILGLGKKKLARIRQEWKG